MARAMMILVSDDQSLAEDCRNYGQQQGVTVQVYSSSEWQSRLSEPDFHQQLMQGVPSLAMGTSPVDGGAKILPFPGKTTSVEANNNGRVKTINELESMAIENAIYEFNGNLTEAAKALGIGRATLYRKVKQYNIDPSQARKKRAA